ALPQATSTKTGRSDRDGVGETCPPSLFSRTTKNPLCALKGIVSARLMRCSTSSDFIYEKPTSNSSIVFHEFLALHRFLLTLTPVLALPSLVTVPTYASDETSLSDRSNAATLSVLVCGTNQKCSKTPEFPVKQCQSVADHSGGYPSLQWLVGYTCDVWEETGCPSKSKTTVKGVEGPGINILADWTAIGKGITQVGSFRCYRANNNKSRRDADATGL
ncbi:hypothetical protein Tdes44962_MAKER05933, partial [Teratosphaeria destructans]